MSKKDRSAVSSTPVEQEHISVPENHSIDQEDESFSNDSPGVIILHPGSCTLRLGLSTQLDPFYIPHLIAYRNKSISHDSSATPTAGYRKTCDGVAVLYSGTSLSEELLSQRETSLERIQENVTEYRANNGVFDAESDTSQYTSLNENNPVVPCTPDDEVTFQFSDLGTSPQFVIGNEVLHLPVDASYDTFKPLRFGKLNISSGISRSVVLKQLEDLWCRAIEECLDIPRKDFKFYRVILLVSDLIDRITCKDFVDILLLRLEFEAALVHQESVCATYGAGLSTACVVDVGEERTHICCVEDGMSNSNTRATLQYGGNDITRFFYYLLKTVGFPYKTCSEDSIMDAGLLQKLKEKYCHFDMTVWGVAEEEVIIPYLGQGGMKFNVHFADELVYAPMGVFYPSSFCLPDDKSLMSGQETQPVMLEDIFDEANWSTEQSQQSKGATTATSKSNCVTDSPSSASVPSEILPEATKRLQGIQAGRILALDQAVHFSIDCTASSDMKKKLYSSVLLIGGGLAFSQAATILQLRLESSLPLLFSKGSDAVEVSSNPRELNPKMVSWRGGAVLAMLDSCQELWIEHQDWELFGVRLLRERALFVW